MSHLEITTGSGFFSCSTEALLHLVIYSSINGKLPDSVDRSKQYDWHKSDFNSNLIPYYFMESTETFDVFPGTQINTDGVYSQFCDYRTIQFDMMKLYLEKYFKPSFRVEARKTEFIEKYAISPQNTCAVFYRGNDKVRETPIANYSEFISQAEQIKQLNPTIEFLVQTDEAEFLESFLQKFPNSKFIDEIPRISKQDACVTQIISKDQRPQFGIDFLSSVLILAECQYLITHSGNCGFWSVLYRGSFDGVRQWQNDHWIV